MSNVEEKTERQIERQLPVKPKQSLIPSDKSSSSELEKSIIKLNEELSNISDLKFTMEEIFQSKKDFDSEFQANVTSSFNSLRKQLSDFNEKINNEIDYRQELELKIHNNDLKGQVYILDKELNEERANITKMTDNINIIMSNIKNKVDEITNVIDKKCNELCSANDIIEKAILDFRKDSSNVEENNFATLKISFDKLLNDFTEKSNQSLESIKKKSIEFIKQCENENKELIKKIPYIKDKKPLEHILILIIGCIGIASFILTYIL